MKYNYIILILILFFWSCEDNNDPFVGIVDESIFDYDSDDFSENMTELDQLDYSSYMTQYEINVDELGLGVIKDLLFSDNRLFVATDNTGIFIYDLDINQTTPESIKLSNGLYINEIYQNISWSPEEEEKQIRNFHYIKDEQILFAHDRFRFMYQGYLPNLLNEAEDHAEDDNNLIKNEDCEADESHVTQLVIEEVDGEDPVAHVLYKRLYTTNDLEGNEVELNYSVIKKHYYMFIGTGSFGSFISFCDDAIDIPDFEDCDNFDNCAIKDDFLGYDVNDMYYLSKENFQDGTGRYFVANHEDNAYSYAMIKEFDPNNDIEDEGFLSIISTETEVKSIYATSVSDNKYVFAGTRDGCYITLLEDDGISQDPNYKLHIAENFTIYDIFYDEINQILLLSCGSDGVLVYSWDGASLSIGQPMIQLKKSFAWTAEYHQGLVYIGTNGKGLEIFKID